MILTEKQQMYQHYRQGKLINRNILQVNEPNDLIIDKLKDIMQLQNNIKLHNLEQSRRYKKEENIFSANTHYLQFF